MKYRNFPEQIGWRTDSPHLHELGNNTSKQIAKPFVFNLDRKQHSRFMYGTGKSRE
jgi:hypothetical protein